MSEREVESPANFFLALSSVELLSFLKKGKGGKRQYQGRGSDPHKGRGSEATPLIQRRSPHNKNHHCLAHRSKRYSLSFHTMVPTLVSTLLFACHLETHTTPFLTGSLYFARWFPAKVGSRKETHGTTFWNGSAGRSWAHPILFILDDSYYHLPYAH